MKTTRIVNIWWQYEKQVVAACECLSVFNVAAMLNNPPDSISALVEFCIEWEKKEEKYNKHTEKKKKHTKRKTFVSGA